MQFAAWQAHQRAPSPPPAPPPPPPFPGSYGVGGCGGACGFGGVSQFQFDVKLRDFDGTNEKWVNWKWHTLNQFIKRDPRMAPEMDRAEAESVEIPASMADPYLDDWNKRLYGILGDYVQGKGLTLIQSVGYRGGFEAWRRLCKEYQPRGPTRKVLWKSQLLRVDLSGPENAFEQRLQKWEKDVRDFETQTGGSIGQDDKCGVLLMSAPPSLSTILQLTPACIEDWTLMRFLADDYFQKSRQYSTEGGTIPMEFNALGTKGLGKGSSSAPGADKKKQEEYKKKEKERKEKEKKEKEKKKKENEKKGKG